MRELRRYGYMRLNKIFRLAGLFYHIRLAYFRRPVIVASGANVKAERKNA